MTILKSITIAALLTLALNSSVVYAGTEDYAPVFQEAFEAD